MISSHVMLLMNLSRAMEVMESVETKTETEVSMGITLQRRGSGVQGQYLISRISRIESGRIWKLGLLQ